MTALSLLACDDTGFPESANEPEHFVARRAIEVPAPDGGSRDAGSVDAHIPRPSTWRIVPLGDSITETSCTSQLLWKKLRESGHTNFDLIGSRTNQQGCGVENPDRDCEGHSGYLVTDLATGKSRAAELARWSSENRADVVLMHFGTNDVWNNLAPAQILQAYADVVASLRRAQPNVIVFVAQIIPMSPSGCAECGERVKALNRQIPAWAENLSTARSPVYVVDQWTGFETARHTYDGVHPTLDGAKKMADAWFAALVQRKLF